MNTPHVESGSQDIANISKAKWYAGLYIQVLVAVVCGGLLGWLYPQWGVALMPLGDAFVRLIKMMIGPIIFTTVVAHRNGQA